MIRDKKIDKKKEIDELFDLIGEKLMESGFEGGLDKDTRKQEYVYAKMAFTRILLDAGHSHEDIADKIGRDRTVTYHYTRVFWELYSQKKFLNYIYESSKLEFFSHVSVEKSEEKKSLVFNNKEQDRKIKKLEREIYELKSQNIHQKYDLDRFGKIFDSISDNLKKGRENLMERKIFNYINTVNQSDEPLIFKEDEYEN